MPQYRSYPSATDYRPAIQSPQYFLKDNELRSGSVLTNQLRLPIGVSGTFAVVYQLTNKGKIFAVRCFIKPVTNQQRRYNALSQYLSNLYLPMMVDFAYLPQGILVRGEWYPIVKMEWIPGIQLHEFVKDNLQNRQTLEHLAAQWLEVVTGLRKAHIAHGDLQHGNILIDGQMKIRLVDYDGIFIPALRKDPPGEVGHPNYQHPERIQKGYYEENADAFSSIVIYLSLLALMDNQSLWKFHNDENLIFVSDDFTKPGQTPVWKQLRKSQNPQVLKLTLRLEEFCKGPVSAVPDLEKVIQEPYTFIQPPPVIPPTPVIIPPTPPSTKVTCPKCGHVNAADEIYCQSCVHQLCGTRTCPSCNKDIPTKSIYCPRCRFRL